LHIQHLHFIFILVNYKIKTCHNANIHTDRHTYIHSMQPSHMDALHDVHEKIKMKKEREMHAQQQQQPQQQPQQQQQQQYQQPPYEIRDPHGILYLLRSRL